MPHFLQLLFSSISYSYTSDLTSAEIETIVLNKSKKATSSYLTPNYTCLFDADAHTFSIIRKGIWHPVEINGVIDTQANQTTITLTFKSLISPFILFAPIALFLHPYLFSGRTSNPSVFILPVLGLIFFLVLIILFVYHPVKKERKNLERALKLTQH